jgi:hypothetical protein
MNIAPGGRKQHCAKEEQRKESDVKISQENLSK